VEIITTELGVLQVPPAPKRWKTIWKHELESAIENKEELYSPDYSEIKRQRKKKPKIVKSKRKIKSKKSKR